MSRSFRTVIIYGGQGVHIPRKSVAEVVEELEHAKAAGEGYKVYAEDNSPGIMVYIPSWQLAQISTVIAQDMELMEQDLKMREEAARSAAVQRTLDPRVLRG